MRNAITTNPSNTFKNPLSRNGLVGYLRSMEIKNDKTLTINLIISFMVDDLDIHKGEEI